MRMNADIGERRYRSQLSCAPPKPERISAVQLDHLGLDQAYVRHERQRIFRLKDRIDPIEEADPADPTFADEFYNQLRDVFAKQNLVPTYSIDRVRALIRNLAPAGRILLLRARDPEGRCIATAVLPWYHRTMYFWGGASQREHQHLRPNEALIWHAMRWARARGVTEFDFVGGNSYKAKYGTTEVPVPWARRSRSPLVASLRDAAQQGFALKQRAVARLTGAHA